MTSKFVLALQTVACPLCKAMVGEHCVTISGTLRGRKADTVHNERLRAYDDHSAGEINPLEYLTACEDRDFDAEHFARGLETFCAQADGVEATLPPAWSNRHTAGFWAKLVSGREFSITVTRLR